METATRPLEEFLSLMDGVQIDGPNSWKCYCKIHEDDGRSHDPSLQVTENADGKILIYCHVCKDRDIGPKICAKIGFSIRKLFPDYGRPKSKSKRRRPEGKKTAEYEYRDIDGATVFKVMRYETADGGKTFAQARPNGTGGWILNMRGVKRIPYRLPELVAADKSQPVFIVEGEKKVDALRTWGQVATCNVGGAGKWNNEFATYFRDRRVVILPDNDPVDPQTGRRVGLDHASKVFANLKPIAQSVRILELPGLPPKGDVVDWQADGHTLAELLGLVAVVEADAAGELPPADQGKPAEVDPLSIEVDTGRTDVAAGQRLIRKYGENLRYCSTLGKWFVWNGTRWTVDNRCYVDRWSRECSEELWQDVLSVSADRGEPTIKKMKSWTVYANSWSGLSAAVKAAKTAEEIQVSTGQLDSNPWLLNCSNGTVDLQTGKLREHSREDMLTQQTPIPFDPAAECPVWMSFLHATFQGDEEIVDYMQRLAGYWATGIIRDQILPILWGKGSNGKTTLQDVLMEVLGGDYAMKAAQDFLMAKAFDSHPTEKADLFGKRLVFCSETDEGKRLSESLVKDLTGRERIRARRMREDFWEFAPTHKIALTTNHKPVVTGMDHGIWRRIRLIEFGQHFWNPDEGETGPPELCRDQSLPDRLRAEYPGILRWIVDGCLLWQRDGEQVPKAVRDETRSYRGSQDVIAQWLGECCEVDQHASSVSSELYDSFKSWCEVNGEFCVSHKRFSASLVDRGFQKDRTRTGRFFVGLRLIPAGSLF